MEEKTLEIEKHKKINKKKTNMPIFFIAPVQKMLLNKRRSDNGRANIARRKS